MGLGNFFKSLVNSEVAGDQTIAAIELVYRVQQSGKLDEDPHQGLARVYLMRKSGLGKLRKDAKSLNDADMAGYINSCVPPPYNIRALALFLLFSEREDIMKRYPKFLLEYGELMAPVYEARDKGKLDELYRKYNPRSAAE